MLSELSDIAKQALIQPQEAMLKTRSSKKSFSIGVPKETGMQENRTPLTPLSVALLVQLGHKIIFETGAGEGANFSDDKYSEQGAIIAYSAKEVYKCDIVIKVTPPTFEEIALMKPMQILLSSLVPASLKAELLEAMIKKRITALAFEYFRDEGGSLSVVRSMGEIVGATSILIAAEYLSNPFGGKGLMLGGITGVPCTEIVILGAGTVAEYAARTAIALGAQVKVFDESLYRLKRIQNNISNRVFTSVMQPIVMQKAIASSDVVIGAIRAEHGRSPCVVSEETVSRMKPNSVIIDVSIDQGGCFETSELTTHDRPVFRKYDVIHYCVPNIASRVARTATYALTNIFTPVLQEIGELGCIKKLIWKRPGILSATYLFQGHLTNADLAERFNLPLKDLELMIVSNR